MRVCVRAFVSFVGVFTASIGVGLGYPVVGLGFVYESGVRLQAFYSETQWGGATPIRNLCFYRCAFCIALQL